MKIELTDDALLDLACMCERQTILDENKYQEYKKAYRAFDDAVCRTLEERVQKKIW